MARQLRAGLARILQKPLVLLLPFLMYASLMAGGFYGLIVSVQATQHDKLTKVKC
jgi:hypothetical protein